MYNLNSCSGFSCSYSSISKSYSRSAGSGLDNIVYSMSDSIAVAKDSYSDTNFESTMIRAYDSHDEYQDKGAVAKEALNTRAGVDSSYLVGHQNFNPVSFLNPDRPKARFITNVEELLPIITETFEALTGEDFPDNLSIKICDENELKEIHEAHGGVWVPGIQGFSLNRNGKGVNEVFVRKDALDSMMLTIGHEIGHVMTPTLKDPVDEESKAFAFSLAWIKTIKDNNIADLAGNISPNPARNGLHDKAFSFVIKILNQGKSAFQTFKEIAKGEFKSTQIVEVY